MIVSLQIKDKNFKIDSSKPLEISIPLDFYGLQPNAYDVSKAVSIPCEAENLIGDTRRGGSCNFEQITLIPHCNGTHTECVGHITDERISVNDCLKDVLIPAILISVEPEKAANSDENYAIKLANDDWLISRKGIEKAFTDLKFEISEFKLNKLAISLIVRTLPNDKSKLERTYLNEIPPFFTTEAMKLMREIGVKHLLVDLPSIDRIFDEGKLSNHRIFWNVEAGSRKINRVTLINYTITELIYVDHEIADGVYLLNLQIAPFVADASPSRPVIFKVFD
jgi:kynurenine formamidase